MNRFSAGLFVLFVLLQGHAAGQTSLPVFDVSDERLNFVAAVGGNLPAEQSLVITSNNAALPFTIEKLPGESGSPAANWVTVTPASGTSPTYVIVSVNPFGLPQGRNTARIRIVPTGGGTAKEVALSLTIQSQEPVLEFSPKVLEFRSRAGSTETIEQTILFRNQGGGGSITVSGTGLGQTGWLTSVTPSQARTSPEAPVPVRVTVNAQGLAPGSYRDVIRITYPGGTEDIPVVFFVAAAGPVLGVDSLGLWAHGAAISYTVQILNLGTPGTKVNWTAEILSGGNWLSLAVNKGVAEPGKPSRLRLPPLPAAASFDTSDHYALIRISDPNAINSPQYVTAVLEVPRPGSAPVPDITPVGLVFSAVERGPAPAAQKIELFAGTTDIVPYLISATTRSGGPWLSSSPGTGTVTFSKPLDVMVSVNPAGLKPGVYTGDLNFTMAREMRTANITLVVRAAETGRSAIGCDPTRLYLTSSFTPNNFDSHVGWPVLLTVSATDDCGDPVHGASVSASFTTGDTSVALAENGDGSYSTTWVPGRVQEKVNVSFIATHRALGTAGLDVGTGVDMTLHGRVATNPSPIRSVNRWGLVRTLAPALAGTLAPGSVATIYGTNLADLAVSASSLPLPTTLRGTRIRVGDFFAPLFYVSPSQINFQIPVELLPERQYPVTVLIGDTVTIPQIISLVAAQPGVAVFGTGETIAVRENGSLVTRANTARPGEVLTVYLVGMGATNPGVKTGEPTPSLPLANSVIRPSVSLARVPVDVLFSGLTPGGVGLYQINFRVPQDTRPGMVDLLIRQGEASSNTSQLAVGP